MTEQEKPTVPTPGYFFAPKRDQHSPGHPRLEITIVSEPSENYFDPIEVQLSILASKDWGHPHQLDHIKIFHPWPNNPAYRTAPGMVIIMDRKGKEAEAFTFGGELQIITKDTHTTCTLESPAPIIEVEKASHVVKTLVDESKILLAQRRAAWGRDDVTFESRLANISVEELYAVCLEHILAGIEHAHRQDVLDIQELIHLIKLERQSMVETGLWPQNVPTIGEIL